MLRIAYCSNVHAGADLEETRTNLQAYASRVKQYFSPEQPMGFGLWLSSESTRQLLTPPNSAAIDRFKRLLHEIGLDAFTFNGFPFGNFHQKIVKKDVYFPTWYESERFDYTRDLVQLIQQFSSSEELSISTLPLAWGNPPCAKGYLAESARQLRAIAELCHNISKKLVV